jgi:hypothetical protein
VRIYASKNTLELMGKLNSLEIGVNPAPLEWKTFEVRAVV